MADTTTGTRAHETADISGRRIALIAGLLAATLVAVALAAAGVMDVLYHRTARAVTPVEAGSASMPSPPPQTSPSADLSVLRHEKAALLHEYRWIERDRGVVRIPIERAMALLVERAARGKARNPTAGSEATR